MAKSQKAKVEQTDIRTITPDSMSVMGDKLVEDFESHQKMLMERQRAVEKYNLKEIFKLDPRLRNKLFSNGNILIRLFRKNVAKRLDVQGTDSFIPVQDQVPYETRGGRQDLMDNPLPYVDMGIVCAVPTSKEVLSNLDEMSVGIGDVVEVQSVNLNRDRYYMDKFMVDNVLDGEDAQSGNAFENFEGYALINFAQIEAKRIDLSGFAYWADDYVDENETYHAHADTVRTGTSE